MATRAFLLSLKKGQIVRALVEEVQTEHEILCNFQGDLLLLNNHTGRTFRKGDPISLQVTSLHPLQFEIFSSSKPKFQRVV